MRKELADEYESSRRVPIDSSTSTVHHKEMYQVKHMYGEM